MSNYFRIVLFLFCCLSGSVSAQQMPPFSRDHGFVNPRILGMAPAKGLAFTYEILPGSQISSVSTQQAIGNGTGQIDFNRRLQLKIGIPIVLKPGVKLTASLDYRTERFSFDDFEQTDYLLYQNLEGKRLHSMAAAIRVFKPTRGKRYYTLQLKSRLSGDINNPRHGLGDFMDISISPLMGWKESPYLNWGLGLQYTYRADGGHSLFPAFMYNQTFNKRWGIEALLPANIKIRRNFSEKARLYASAALKSARYYVMFEEFSQEPVSLSWSEARIGLTFEREIHDWLWFRGAAGMRLPLGLDLDLESNQLFQRNTLIQSNSGMTPYVSAGIFLVLPKKWMR